MSDYTEHLISMAGGDGEPDLDSVQSAAKVVVEEGAHGVPWGDASEGDREDALEKARRYLEAAHPALLAAVRSQRAALEAAEKAWDEDHFQSLGCDSSCCAFMHDAPKGDMNPIRAALTATEGAA